MISLENDEDFLGYYLRLKGFYPARKCPDCRKPQYMGVYMAPDPGDSGYVCPKCWGFYKLDKREGKKETLKRIGTVMIERIE